jgi:parvulin-like peptidyl-prolyl isomerase
LVLALLSGVASAQDKPDDPTPSPAPAPERPAIAKKKILVERVAAVVNDAVILESEVVQRAAPEMGALDEIEDPRQRQRQWATILRQTLDLMVSEELMLQAAEEAKLDVTSDEVDKALAEVKRSNKLTDKQLEQALAGQGYTIPEYRKDIRKQILRLRAQNVLVRPRVAVTDDEVKAAYEKLSGQSAMNVEVKLRHILISLPESPTQEDLKDARRRAGDYVARARAGEDFGKLALGGSEDLDTKEKGGDLGWYKRGELPDEWEEVLFTMQPGEIRGPVRGPRGLHVFQVVETKKETVRSFDEAKNDLREQLYADELGKQTKVWLEELRKRAHVEIKI